jgi:hypothetical protein
MPTFRGALRETAQSVLINLPTIADQNVLIEADWPAVQRFPAISVNARRWRYEDRTTGTGRPQFWSTIWLTVECRVARTDEGGSGRQSMIDDLDALSDQVEGAMAGFIVGPPQLFRRLSSIDGGMDISAEGDRHIGALTLHFGFEYANDAEIDITTKLEQIRIAVVDQAATPDEIATIEADLVAGVMPDSELAVLPGVIGGADFPVPQDC